VSWACVALRTSVTGFQRLAPQSHCLPNRTVSAAAGCARTITRRRKRGERAPPPRKNQMDFIVVVESQ
jgi:hypothetical protein